MKILLFSTFFLPAEKAGGVPFSTFSFAQSLQSLGAQVSVITTNRNGDECLDIATDRWTKYQGIRVLYCKTLFGPYLFCPRMKGVAGEEAKQSDIIISSSTLWNYPGWLAHGIARRLNLPHIVYPRGILDPWAFQHKAIRKQVFWLLQAKRILKRASYIIALTEHEKTTIQNLGIRTPIEIISNGIDPSNLSDTLTYEELIKIFPQLRENRYLLFLGRIHKKKGLDLLLPSFEKVTNIFKDVMLVLAGPVENMYENEFRELLKKCKTTNKILRPGPVKGKTKNSLLRYAAGFVLTSYSEGLPVAVLEALSVGCPVIVSYQCNITEVFNANAGWVVTLNIDEIAKALYELLSSNTEAKLKGINGKKLIAEKFSWEIVGKRTMDILSSISR